jgi:predicted AlkP superfamily pyrophosphatase or phosphodiesterase
MTQQYDCGDNLKKSNSFGRLKSLSSLALVGTLGFVVGGCQTSGEGSKGLQRVVQVPNSAMLLFDPSAENTPENLNKPYLILISIDGFRHDFIKKFSPEHLSHLANEGVQAESLRPIYPSKTFPSHYSLVTGLYADHHGIVGNEFFDQARKATFVLSDRNEVEDGGWYFGEPIWITAGKQGLLSASFFWVGSEANIQGAHPNYFYRFDEAISFDTRVDQVLSWLKLPPARRPHLITLYFETVDQAGHRFGVESQQVRDAVASVDKQIGRLREGIKALNLPVNIIVVSDHGMADVDAKKVIILDERAEAARILVKFQTVGRGPQILLYLNKGENPSVIDEAQKILNEGAQHFRVYRREQMARLKFSSTPRAGDLVVEPELPYLVGLRARLPVASGANHGWDPKNKLMHGVFVANGPSFKERGKLPTIESVNVYPLMLSVLGLEQRVPIDGSIEATKAALIGRSTR